MKTLASFAVFTGATFCSNAQIIPTIAGNGSQGYTGGGGQATEIKYRNINLLTTY